MFWQGDFVLGSLKGNNVIPELNNLWILGIVRGSIIRFRLMH